MRYLITFRSFGEGRKRTKRVPQERGEQIVPALADGKNIVVNGEFYNASDIESVRKINVENFGVDFAEQQHLAEMANDDERKYLEATKSGQLYLSTENHEF